ncbi:DUF2147 domain-containing protein [Fulvimarina sp. 2208YS6-2-32]|uniref:DUF2147 domain-containing protein n=1 Tax=Fulvimarina uroteuthidis TaxID=3098149 RepID=A0ABU5I6J9_9HYPH|nr:DUF2147 domain-containing protein [Fulvimarina sp. 2208YS6-2-32]MDY8110439.1 DUF2147 domain-containing protein [Fulvimarina sp. 2208YS6-2-32]
MKKQMSVLAAAGLFAMSGWASSAVAAEPIVGQWRAPGGGIVEIAPCGGAYCATVIRGEHKGKSVGQMSGSGASYTGTVTDPRDEKTYAGTVEVAPGGASLKLEGCALKIFCKTQTWTRL